MSFFDKLLAVFKPKVPKSGVPVPTKKVKVKDDSKKEISISPLISKIRYSVKYTTTMINTITLSSDMNTLYLIDGGRAIEFPIDTKDGVLIGLLRGQITVATSMTQEEEEDNSPGGADGEEGRAAPINKEFIRVATLHNQWTFTFHKRTGMVAIIGVTDIDSSFRSGSGCEEHRIDLNQKVIKIKKKGEELELTIFDK
jgi:hypothetical protein